MYVAMDGVESVQKEQKLNSDFVDSFESYQHSQDGSERYEVHRVSMHSSCSYKLWIPIHSP